MPQVAVLNHFAPLPATYWQHGNQLVDTATGPPCKAAMKRLEEVLDAVAVVREGQQLLQQLDIQIKVSLMPAVDASR